MRLKVNHVGITGNDEYEYFTVTVVSPCATVPMTTSSLLISAYTKYAIGAMALTMTIDDSLISFDAACPAIEFEITSSGSALVIP